MLLGTRFGSQTLNLSVSPFEGSRPIQSLAAYPIEHHSDMEGLKSKLIERGGKIEALAGSYYRNYNGVGWKMGSMGMLSAAHYNPSNGSAVTVYPLSITDSFSLQAIRTSRPSKAALSSTHSASIASTPIRPSTPHHFTFAMFARLLHHLVPFSALVPRLVGLQAHFSTKWPASTALDSS